MAAVERIARRLRKDRVSVGRIRQKLK